MIPPYPMDFAIDSAVAILRNTPAELRAMLAGLTDDWVRANYGPDTFSPFDVVGHLIHGEKTDWVPRVRTILEHGEDRPFEPFDRYAMYAESRGKSLAELLDEFDARRAQNLHALGEMHITEEQLDRRGRHPQLGPVTLRQLLATWVVHDLNHLHQIAKCLGYQYRDAIGPWREYLSFIDR